MLIDFHTHILPGIDDGSRNVEMSLRMLAAQREQQVDEIVATPHFMRRKILWKNFYCADSAAMKN